MGKKNKKRNIEEQVDVDSPSIKNKNTKLINSESDVNNIVTSEIVSISKRTKTKKKDKGDKIIKSIDNQKSNQIAYLILGDNSDLETNIDNYEKCKKKKHTIANIENDDDQITQHETNTGKNKKKKVNKNKLIIKINDNESIINMVNDDDQITKKEISTDGNKKKRKNSTSQHEVNAENLYEKTDISTKTKNNKKIKQQEVEPVHNGNAQCEDNTDNGKKTKKKKKRNIVEEEIINDEDIDKYCEELDEVNNKQYEDWVKLIENSLNSNKKAKV